MSAVGGKAEFPATRIGMRRPPFVLRSGKAGSNEKPHAITGLGDGNV